MRRLYCGWVTFLASLLCCGALVAAPVTFDDLDATTGDLALDTVSPYAGLNWTNFYAYTSVPGFPGFNNGIASGPTAAYSGGELFGARGVEAIAGSIKAPGLMDLTRAYFGSGYYDALTLTVLGLLDGAQLFSRNLVLSTAGAQAYDLGFTGINELRFVASVTGATRDPLACGTFNCTQFTIDDLDVSLRDRDGHSVPEPGIITLIGIALVALVGSRYRAKRVL